MDYDFSIASLSILKVAETSSPDEVNSLISSGWHLLNLYTDQMRQPILIKVLMMKFDLIC